MGLIRLIIVAFIGWVIYSLYRRFKQNSRRIDKEHSPRHLEGESVVQCRTCNLHIPQKDAIRDNGHYYCCKEHRDRE